MVPALNNCFAFDQSHLPNDPIDRVKDPLAYQRYDHLQNGLQLHGVTNADDWRVGEHGMYIVDIYRRHIKDKYGNLVWNTNTAQFWDGAWAEDTNGWRVELNIRDKNPPILMAVVSFGSVVKNSDDGSGDYFAPPRDYLEKFELKSPEGKVIQPNSEHILEKNWPSRIPVKLFSPLKVGPLAGEIWFVTNGPPCPISYQEFRDYAITNEGDYTLTVRPVLYQNRTGKKIELTKDFYETNTNYFDRVDLPSVTTKVHLKPSP